MNIKKIHYFSGIIITLFIGIHLLNHVISIFGADQHIYWMNIFRKVYRNIFIESLLLLAVFTQIISGLRLFFLKRKNVNHFYEKIHIWSGLYLAFFLLFHVSAVLGGRFLLGLDTNFYFGVAGLNTFPFALFFVPYYGLAILAFFGHMAAIHNQKMKTTILGFTPKQQAHFILIKGIFITFAIYYGLTNGFTGVDIPTEYHILIGK